MKNTTQLKILSIGEILWDMLPDGKKLGGAPSNFAYHCQQLGAAVRLVSRVGRDELGNEILTVCDRLRLSIELIGRDEASPTGTVDVHLDSNGIPAYTIVENVAWDKLEVTQDALRWAAESDAICFGSLATRSVQNRETLRQLTDVANFSALRVLDLNLRDPFCEREMIEYVLSCANVLKLNDDELVRVNKMFGITATSVSDQLQQLRERYKFQLVIMTCGADGSWLTTESEQVFTPSMPTKVADTVGAGDSFTAAVVTGVLLNKSLIEIGKKANQLASYVCSQSGGTPIVPDYLRW